MKKILLALLSTTLVIYAAPKESPETPGIQLQKLNEIDKSVKIDKKKAIIDDLNVPKSEYGKAESRVKGPSFTLNNVSITGNTVFDQKLIIEIVKPFINQKVDSIDLKYIAQKITKLYAESGYVTSKCIIPEQKVTKGMVKFQIIENKLGRLLLKGKNRFDYDSNLFIRYIAELQNKILNVKELNKQLKYMSILPVTRIKPSLENTNRGYSNLILEIIESEETFSLSLDNSGSNYTGKERLTLNGNINNIRGKSDRLALSLTTVKDPKYLTSFSSSYVTPYGKEGARLTFGYSHMYYQLDPDKVGTDLFIYEGETDIFSFNYSKPVYSIEMANVNYNLGFEKKSVNSKIIQNTGTANGTPIVDGLDETFVFNAGVNVMMHDNLFSKDYNAINSLSFSVSKALEGFWNSMTQEDIIRKDKALENNSTIISGPIKSGNGLNPSFMKLYYNYTRKQQIPWDSTMTFNLNGNYTSSRVPDAYEYSGGDFGYQYSLVFAKKFWYINTNLSLSQSTVYTYNLDKSLTKSRNKPSLGLSLSSVFDKLYINLSYSSSLDTWDSNNNNIRYNLKYIW